MLCTSHASLQSFCAKQNDSERDKYIILFGSLAFFKEQAGLFIHSPSKHVVMGLFRSTKKFLNTIHGIRVNIVCPRLINTGMSSKVQHIWDDRGLSVNNASQVSDYALTVAALTKVDNKEGLGCQAVYVEGGKGWEIQVGIDRIDSQWMGEAMSRNSVGVQDALGVGRGWTSKL